MIKEKIKHLKEEKEELIAKVEQLEEKMKKEKKVEKQKITSLEKNFLGKIKEFEKMRGEIDALKRSAEAENEQE